ncbi:MAG TPA: hypothetical protein VM578_05900 [Candidatus Saccharimonadales bacterium]|nr:hypothetical protein [Candidatus Saccharimonadales bacterium]
MNSSHIIAKGGSLWKGVGLAFLCQFAYLLFCFELLSGEVRILGYMLFALVQLGYLFPLAVFYRRRNEGLTSNGVILSSVFSLVCAASWFGYAFVHGTFLSIFG